MQASAVSFLYYADRINQLPLGMVGIAIGVVLLPTLTRHLAEHDEAGAMASQNRSLEFALLLTLPATVALVMIPRPIIQVLFQHGSFTATDTIQVSMALAAYACGLPAYVINKVFLPGFFAREDTATPMWFAGASVAVNIGGSLILFPILGHRRHRDCHIAFRLDERPSARLHPHAAGAFPLRRGPCHGARRFWCWRAP